MIPICPIQELMEDQGNWIYYLKLQKNLPAEYLVLDSKFKTHGKSLVPITLSNLMDMTKTKKSVHVLIVVRSLQEYKYFNKKIKIIMKFLIRTGRVHLYVVSSFVGVNDTGIMRRDFYNFMRLPVAYNYLAESISGMVDVKELEIQKWPGGLRSSFQLAG